MIEGVAGLALAITVVTSLLGRPDLLDGRAWILALGWAASMIAIDALALRRARQRVDAIRRGEGGPPPNRALFLALFVVRTVSFAGLTYCGWAAQIFSGSGGAIAAVLVGVAPWVLVWLANQEGRRRLAEARSGRAWPPGSWWALHTRILLLPILASGLMLGLSALLAAADPSALRWLESRRATAFFLGLVVTLPALALIIVPLAARWALPSRSLPAGPFREQLAELARKEGFRPRDIRVIDTSGHIVNAAFVGFAGPFRYVFFTDAILKRLSPEELVGVFAHELGHACRKHALVYLTLIVALSAALTGLGLLGEASGWPRWLIDYGLPLTGFALFFRFVFSPLSRSFETEADLFAVRALGDPEPLARSLEGLGRLYPRRLTHGGPLHPSLRDRVAAARRWPADAEFRQSVRERLRRLRVGVGVFAVGAFFALAAFIPGEWAGAARIEGVIEAIRSDDEAASLAALETLEDDLDAGRVRDPGSRLRFALHQVIATHRQDRGDYAAAEASCRGIRSMRRDLDEPTQVYSAAIILAQQAAATGSWGLFAEELSRAQRSFVEAEALIGPENASMQGEKRDLAWLRRGRLLLERVGVLPATSRPSSGPTADAERPEDRALGWLEARRGENASLSEGAWPQAELEALPERWRLDFLTRLRAAAIR